MRAILLAPGRAGAAARPVSLLAPPLFAPPYSPRKASTGSTRLARRAGSQTASSATAPSSSGTPTKTSGSRAVTPNRNAAMKRERPNAAGDADDDADERQPHALPHDHVPAPARARRRARGGCRSPASAARPSRPSGRRCRSPRAAAPTPPNTVISSMLKRSREVERETTSSIERTSETGRPVACAQLLLHRARSRERRLDLWCGRPRPSASGATFSALAASGTCACGMYIVGRGSLLSPPSRDVADDADDLRARARRRTRASRRGR